MTWASVTAACVVAVLYVLRQEYPDLGRRAALAVTRAASGALRKDSERWAHEWAAEIEAITSRPDSATGLGYAVSLFVEQWVRAVLTPPVTAMAGWSVISVALVGRQQAVGQFVVGTVVISALDRRARLLAEPDPSVLSRLDAKTDALVAITRVVESDLTRLAQIQGYLERHEAAYDAACASDDLVGARKHRASANRWARRFRDELPGIEERHSKAIGLRDEVAALCNETFGTRAVKRAIRREWNPTRRLDAAALAIASWARERRLALVGGWLILVTASLPISDARGGLATSLGLLAVHAVGAAISRSDRGVA